MLSSCSPPQDWFGESEPLLFDEEFCQNLIKDLQSIPTPPQSPPLKTDMDKPLSSVDQLALVSDILLQDNDFAHLDWGCDFGVGSRQRSGDSVSDDCLWPCTTEKSTEDKMSVLSTSPLLADIESEIFAEIVGSTLDCQGVMLAYQQLMQRDDLLLDTPEQSEASSENSSLSAAGESSSSDSEEEIDVVTVRRCHTRSRTQQHETDIQREQHQALKRRHLEIQLQHNYAAPRPSSPPPTVCVKRTRSAPKNIITRPTFEAEADDDDEMRRRTHNVMERQRRNELKNCFLRLRDNVPELSNNDKASKVIILKRAKDSIRNLESEAQRLVQKKDRLQTKHDQLRARLKQLKRL